uniref:Uncharacterized protein n=1 Tax=Picea sitchensis TaxID=3332 RepID=A0A6B9XTU3_PICSI|nr:hypothetical protein Q903MT_gene6956 [Picea sitchensis]
MSDFVPLPLVESSLPHPLVEHSVPRPLYWALVETSALLMSGEPNPE